MYKKSKVCTAVLAALGGSLALGALTAHAQSQRIEITGSAIKRTDAETALPVSVITRADIERTGVTSAQDLVNLIPSNFGGTTLAQNVGATGVASTAALRGLSAKYTLVLLNGRRIANYAFGNQPVDLNSIPLSAIERVEVLRDGASAIYGADAVAGVINFIMRKDYQGLEASVFGSAPQKTGGGVTAVNITGGFGDLGKQGFNFLISANHEEDKVLKAKDRSFANTANRPDLGINKASPRNGIPNLNFIDTNGNGYGTKGNGTAPLINPFRATGCNSTEFALVIRDATTCGTDYVKFIDLIPKQTHDNIVGRGVFALGADNEIYVEAAHVNDKFTAVYSPAPYTLTMSYPATGRFYPTSIVVPKGTLLQPGYKLNGTVLTTATTLANDITVTPTGAITGTWRTVAGGGRTDITDQTTDRFQFGARGILAGWDYDTALTYSKNKGTISFGPGKFGYSTLTPLVASGEINVFGPQDSTSQAKLNSALLTGPEQTATSTSTEFDVRVSKDIVQLPAGNLGLALGASYRKEKLDQFSYPVLESGDEVGGSGPIPGVKGDRKVYGLYTELAIPIVKSLDASVSARYDNYKNGFGTSFNSTSPKVSLRFQPIKEVLLRGSYGEGYRAPTLYENLRPLTIGNNTAANWSDATRCPGGVPITNTINPVDSSTECNVQQNTANEGNKALNPEKSSQFSLGIVLQPLPELSVTLDYWDLKIKNAILAKSEIQVMSAQSAYGDFIYRYDPAVFTGGYDLTAPPQPGLYKSSQIPAGKNAKDLPIAYIYLPYDNTGKFFASGIDVNVDWKQRIPDIGQFGVTLDGTLFTKHGYEYFASPKVSDIGEYKDFGPVPRWRHNLTFSFKRGEWGGSVTNSYMTGYNDYTNPDAIGPTYPAVRKVAAYSLWDARVQWTGIKNLDITVGVKNLLNTDPPSSRTEVNFQTGYDAQWTNPIGRAFYTKVRYKFF
jgi:iron complex outermembrane receptor protein